MSAVYVQPATAAEFQKQLTEARRHRLQGEIGIFYDPFDAVISQTAWDVSTALDMANVSSSLHEVSSAFELEVLLNETGVWIAIYLFNSGLESISLGREIVGWEDFAQILLRYKGVHHILGIGNTRKLAEFVGEGSRNIHLANTDLVDAELTFLYSLWAVAEVLESTKGYRYREAELDIRIVGLKFFADNFNDLFERTLEPKVPLGEEDMVQKQKDFENLKERFPKTVRELPPIPPSGITPNVEMNTGSIDTDSLLADASSVPSPRLYLTQMSGTSTAVIEPISAGGVSATSGSAVEQLFKVLDIPMKSGLDGPIGSVLDFLLEVLIEVGGYTSAALGEDTVEKIVEAVSAIKTIIGLVEDFEGKSALKGLFDLIKLEFPALEEYEKFFDLFVDALYAFRGDLQDIVDWVRDAMGVLLDELGLSPDTRDVIKDVLEETLTLGEELYETVESSGNILEALLSWFVERISPRIVEKFLSEACALIPGSSYDKMTTEALAASKITSVLNAIVNFIVTSDSAALLENLVDSVFDVFGPFEDLGYKGADRIAALIKFVCAVLGYSPKKIDPGVVLDFSRITAKQKGCWPLWEAREYDGVTMFFETGTITDVFASGRDMNYDGKMDEFHEGIDIAAPKGTAVFPVAPGKVSGIWGNLTHQNLTVSVMTSTGLKHYYGHVQNITKNIGDPVGIHEKLAEIGPHSTLEHLHFAVWKPIPTHPRGGIYLNPLGKNGPLEDRDTAGKPTAGYPRIGTYERQIYPWEDDAGALGQVDPTRRFVSGNIDIVVRAFDPSQPFNAGVMQLMWVVDRIPTKKNDPEVNYLMKDGYWDSTATLDNNLAKFMFKETYPADTNDRAGEYYYIITNTDDTKGGQPQFLNDDGCWNTKLQRGYYFPGLGPDAASNAEAKWPDGWHFIFVRAGSDILRDKGDWGVYRVNINNFEQTVESADSSGNPDDDFINEFVYIVGEGYAKRTKYDVYVFEHKEDWNRFDGVNLEDLDPLYETNVTSNGSGHIKKLLMAYPPSGEVDKYDIVVDVDGDGIYSAPRFDKSIDALDDTVEFCVTVTADSGEIRQNRTISEEAPLTISAPWSCSDSEIEHLQMSAMNEEEDEVFEEAFRNFADQVLSEIKEAVEQGQTNAIAFREKIRDHLEYAIEQAGLTVEESTKNAMVDAIVLVAGVMNPKFAKSELPTLLTVTHGLLADLSFSSESLEIVDTVMTSTMATAAIIKDDSDLKQVISGVIDQFDDQYGSIGALVSDMVELTLGTIGVDSTTIENVREYIDTFTAIGEATLNIIKASEENTIQGIIQTIIQGVGFTLSQCFHIDLQVYSRILEIAFPQAMGVTKPLTPQEAAKTINDLLQDLGVDPDITEVVKTVVKYIAEIRDIFTDGYRWIFNQLMDWLSGKVEELANYLENELNNILSQYSFFHLEGEFSLGLGSFSAFGLKYDLAIDAGVNLKTDELFTFVSSIIFDGYDLGTGTTEDTLKTILSFVEIVPLFKGSLELGGFGSNANPFMNTLLESLGVEIQFSGGGHFTIQLLSFKGGAFERSGFLKVIEWGFYFTIEISRDFTLFDFLTGGVGGGALNKLAEYIGLDGIVLTVFFSLTVEIIKRAASPMGPEQATFTLIIEIGVALTIGISILIASIRFYGELKVVFTFVQDLLGDTPLKIFMDLVARIKVTIELLFIDIKVKWGPKTLYHHDFTAGSKSAAEEAGETMGVDKDHDGLSDEYEKSVPGLRPDSNDTDGDGLTDKEETQTTKTDPTNWDTDGDGLNDYDEIYVYKTHPKRVDTDYDGLSDYEEIIIYETKPTVMDTDEDGLDDYYEVNHVWDISNVTTSVKEVWIGGVAYNDHTDPLDPDTDEDGLLDGEEGPAGPYYGLEDLYNKTAAEEGEIDKDPLIFNYGYTHPLDNDTDDDSYLQLWDGSKALVKGDNVFLRSMTDEEEVKGIWVTFITEGEPNRTLVRTNPCNPDTDGDTGRTPGEVPIDAYLNSDGYELSLNPPTDPTNGDTDHDGLIDGLEGVLARGSRHTNPNNPDTDGDGLGDMQEILLGTDPRNADTDFDLVLDGDEYHRFHTDPHLADSDYDGLEDYEELFFWHSNPNLRDSDADGISDGEEVLKYDTDPMDEDTDNDGLTDYDEIFKHGTDPFNPDTDRDGLRDYEEAKIYLTDPLNWDTDGDSIPYPNEYGEMTWPMSDGDEVFKFQTDPARTDTDNDGLSDSIELYLGSGRIPRSVLEPIPLNSTNNDTDGDGLLDGVELRIGNTTSIIYPYLALMPYSYYNTSVLIADTDGDGLSDFEEVNGTLPSDRSFEAGVAKFNYTGSMPYLWDTDNDTLSDGDEVFYHGTDPARADTDGDGLADNEEVTLTGVMVGYGTSALNPDTDGDLLPDGYEIDQDIIGDVTQKHGIDLDPLNADANNNGILDGYEIDLDNDGLSDGEEFFIYNTYESWKKGSAFAGGFLNSDSDGDGLSDGVEVNEFGTDPVKYDTDGDGYSDGAEVAVGTDPLQFTSPEEYEQALNIFRAGKVIRIVYPKNTTLSDITADVRVVNSTLIDTMWFRYNDGTGWSSNYTLQYDAANMQWEYADIIWPEGSYWIQVFGNKTTGYIVWDQQWFTIHIEEEEIPFFMGWSIKILSPANTTIYDKYVDVRVVNATEVVNMWFRYDSGAGWLGNYTLQYNSATQEWENTTVIWPEGPYLLQVFAFTTSGNVIWDEQWFTIAVEKVELGWIEIMSPANTTILDTTVDVLVVNSTVVDTMWFRYDSGEGWSNNYTLNYNSANQRWENITIVWPEGSYHLQVFAARPDEEVLSDEEWFTIYVEKPAKPPFQLYLLVLGVVIGGAGTSASFVLLQRRKRSTEMRKGRRVSKKGGE